MSLTRSIAKNTLVQIIGKAISTILGLIAIGIITRTLGAEKIGWYSTATGFLQFVGIFSDFGFTAITAKMLSEPQLDKTKLLNNLFTWRFLTALFFQGLAPFAILFFPYPAPIKLAVAIMSLSFFAISANQIFIGYCQSALKMATQMTGEILGRIILIVGLTMVAAKNYGFLPAMAVITLASVVYTFYLWQKSPGVKFSIDPTISKIIFQKIWPTAITVIFNAFYLQGDRVILPLYTSQINVGLYSVAYRILDVVAQTAAMIMGIMMPLVTFAWSRNLIDEFKRKYQMSLDLVALFLIPMIAGIIVLANPIMILMYPGYKNFSDPGKILQILSVAILGIAFGNIFGYMALAIDRQRQAMWIYFSDAVLTTIAYFILIPKYGIFGAAAAAIFSELYAGLGLMLLANYYAKFFPKLKTLAKITLASAIMGGLLYKLQPLNSHTSINLVLSIIVGASIYALLVIGLKVISKQTIIEVIKRD
ncbi:MAG TPA: oligosaccharide flippase family protein [Candidatus Udaeobacter sp.]|nr:oligosaccharide flippase family protein [Candidatus Udaeobacter sp.]